jgi:hypothetical protein
MGRWLPTDPGLLVTCSGNKDVIAWDTTNQESVVTFKLDETPTGFSISSFSPSNFIVAGMMSSKLNAFPHSGFHFIGFLHINLGVIRCMNEKKNSWVSRWQHVILQFIDWTRGTQV